MLVVVVPLAHHRQLQRVLVAVAAAVVYIQPDFLKQVMLQQQLQ